MQGVGLGGSWQRLESKVYSLGRHNGLRVEAFFYGRIELGLQRQC